MHIEKRSESRYAALVEEAERAQQRAYTPYSHFNVGAALEDTNGRIWHGCNIESASYTPTNCAERTAVFKAVSEGVTTFKAIAVVGKDEHHDHLTDDFTAPCGVCRQVLAEFCDPDFPVILGNSRDELQVWTLGELLPLMFTKSNLDESRK